MAGQPEFNQLATIAAMSSKSLAYINAQSVAPLPNNAYERLNIYSPPNTISKVVNITVYFKPVTEAGAAGNKTIFVDTAVSPTQGLSVANTLGAFGADLSLGITGPQNHTSSNPSDVGAMSNNFNNLTFDDVVGIAAVFLNGSQVTTSVARGYYLFVQREVVKR